MIRCLVVSLVFLGWMLGPMSSAADPGRQRPISGTVRAIDPVDRTFWLGPTEVHVPVGAGDFGELVEGQGAIVYFRGDPADPYVTAVRIEPIPSTD